MEAVSINLRINYIHAEKIVENFPPQLQVQLQMNVPSAKPVLNKENLKIPFTVILTTTPAIANITIKGVAILSSKPETLKKIYNNILSRKVTEPMQLILQYIMLEVIIIAREIGLPPFLIPLPQKPSKPPSSTTVR